MKLTAARLLADCRSLDEAKQLPDLVEAAHKYAQVMQLGLDAQNHAAEIKLRAERRLGERGSGKAHCMKGAGQKKPMTRCHRFLKRGLCSPKRPWYW
jgi:hypothetical protein